MSSQTLAEFRAFRRQQEQRRARGSLVRRTCSGVVHLVRGPGGRWPAALAMAVAVLLTGSVAVAAWLSLGSGAGAATATTVEKASAPTVVRSANAAAISWNPVTLANGVAVTGYRVQRHVGSTVTTVCTTTEPLRSCSDNAPFGGTQQYGVIATRGSWTGAESDLTSFVGDTTAPTTTIERSPVPDANGWNATDVRITLTATDAGAGVKEIHRTIDGVETVVPVSGATAQITFVVSREDALALAFWSVDSAGNAGAPSSTQFVKIDKTAPVTAAAVTSAGSVVNGWYTAPASVALNATDTSPFTGALASGVTSVQHQTGGTSGSWLAYSGAIPVGEGTTTVYFRSTDLAGNVETARSREVKVDPTAPTLTAPTVSGGTRGSNDWYVGAVAPVVRVTASDATSGVGAVEYQVGGAGPWSPYDAVNGVSVPESTGPSGTQLRFRATDVAGNVATSPAAFVRYDRTAPSVPTVDVNPALNDGSNGYYRSAPTVLGRGSADQVSGLAQYEYQLNGGAWTTAAGGFAVPDGGAQLVGVRAVDAAGNTTGAVTSSTLKVDTVKPTVGAAVTGGTLGQNGYHVSDPTIRFTGADGQGSGLARLEYSVDGGTTYVPVANNGTLVWSTQGATTFTTRATDLAGNTATEALTVKVDSQLPTAGGAQVSPASPNGQSGWYRTRPGITLAGGTDTAGGSGYAATEYQYGATNGSSWLVFATQLLVPDTGPAGTTLYWRGRDGAGNASAPSSLNLKVDAANPSTVAAVSGTAGNNGYYRSSVGVVLTPSDTDPGSGVASTQYQVTASSSPPASWSGASTGTTASVTAQGASYLWYRSTDVAGNTETARALPLLIDSTRPALTNAYPGTGTYSKNEVWPLSGSCAAGQVCIDANDTASGSGIASVSYTMTLRDTPSTCFVPAGAGQGPTQGTTGVTSGCVQTMTQSGSTSLYRSGVAFRLPASNRTAYVLTISVTDSAGNTETSTQAITSSN